MYITEKIAPLNLVERSFADKTGVTGPDYLGFAS